ncbi:hypothetical protein D3C87_1905070 [compost metagenome]
MTGEIDRAHKTVHQQEQDYEDGRRIRHQRCLDAYADAGKHRRIYHAAAKADGLEDPGHDEFRRKRADRTGKCQQSRLEGAHAEAQLQHEGGQIG